jgi:hypothetical protein
MYIGMDLVKVDLAEAEERVISSSRKNKHEAYQAMYGGSGLSKEQQARARELVDAYREVYLPMHNKIIADNPFFRSGTHTHRFLDGEFKDQEPQIPTVLDDQGRTLHAVTLLEEDSEGFGVEFPNIRDTVRGL